jgi:hypothetical protein
MLALPCVPNGGTVTGTFGPGTPSDLDSPYGVSGSGWAVFARDVAATPPSYRMLGAGDPLASGAGYWFKSYQAPIDGRLEVAGSRPATPVDPAEGCASANGCVAVPVTTVAGTNRYNLVGNPFAHAVDWAEVRIRIGGSGGAVYTPSQAAGVAAEGNAATPVLSHQIWIWNGNSYDTYSDTPPTAGALRYFTAFWVNVLPGAFGQSVELLIPAQPGEDTAQRGDGAARSGLLAWLDWLIPAAAADDGVVVPGRGPEERPARGWARPPAHRPSAPVRNAELDLRVVEAIWSDGLAPEAAVDKARSDALAEGLEWTLRLSVDEPATGFKDHNNLLGQLLSAADGYDAHDLIELPPYAAPYLTLVFPRPEWGAHAGDYASDFRASGEGGRRAQSARHAWDFEIRADRPGSAVVVHWDGPSEILRRSVLIDRASGARLAPSHPRYADGYSVTLGEDGTRAFTWQIEPAPGKGK